MKEKALLFANIGLYVVAVMILGSFQTSFWFQIFGYFPSPAFWLPCLIYFSLHRGWIETILLSYLVGFVLSTMTAMPEGMLMLVCMSLALSVKMFKRRIYWETSTYMMLICGLGALVMHLY